MADALGRVPLLAGLRRHELKSMSRGCEDMDVRAGRVLCCEGDFGRQFFVIVEGEVELSRGGRLVRRLGPGAFFGETPSSSEPTPPAPRGHRRPLLRVVQPGLLEPDTGNTVVETRILRELVVENASQRNVAESNFREQLELNATRLCTML